MVGDANRTYIDEESKQDSLVVEPAELILFKSAISISE